MTGESAVLTATVLDGDGEPVEGATVSFSSNITNSTVYSNITNSEGVVEYEYASGAVGDVEFTASIGGLESEACLVEDCFAYYLPEQTINGYSSSDTWVNNLPPTFTKPDTAFSFSFDLKTNGNSFEAGITNGLTGQTPPNSSEFWCCIGKSGNGTATIYGHKDQGSNSTFTGFNNNTYYPCEIRINGTEVKAYFNNSLKSTVTSSRLNITGYQYGLGVCTWRNGAVINVRNVKVKKTRLTTI